MRRLFVAVVALVIGVAGATPIEAEEGTRCTFQDEVTVSPGLGVSAPHASAPREQQPDPRLVALCLALGGSVDQCLGYFRQEGG